MVINRIASTFHKYGMYQPTDELRFERFDCALACSMLFESAT